MQRVKVRTKDEIINLGIGEKVFEPLKERIVETVMGILGGMKESLEAELEGIGLLVMQTVMDLEIEKVAGTKGKRQKNRQYNWWGTNPGSVVLDGKKVKTLVPRAVEHDARRAYEVKSYG